MMTMMMMPSLLSFFLCCFSLALLPPSSRTASGYTVTFVKVSGASSASGDGNVKNVKNIKIDVNEGETILESIERHGNKIKLPAAKSCERGNCLTCACRISSNSKTNSYLEKDPDGFMTNDARVMNYILPCNSVPVNNDLVIDWDDEGGIQDELIKLQTIKRYNDEQDVDFKAKAKAMSGWAFKDPKMWVKKMNEMNNWHDKEKH